MKKRIISIFLILSIIGSLFAISAVNTSAAIGFPSKTNVYATNTYLGIDLKWDEVKDARGYQIFYQEVGTGWKNIHTAGTIKYFPDLKSGKEYAFQVRPYIVMNGQKVYGNYSSVRYWTFIKRPYQYEPKNFSNQGYMKIRWDGVYGADYYTVWARYVKPNGWWSGWQRADIKNATEFKWYGLEKGTKFQIKVSAVKNECHSKYSDTKTITYR